MEGVVAMLRANYINCRLNVMGDDLIGAPGACVAETFRYGAASERSRYALCARSHAV
jgi:hypothetical protein